MSASGGETLAPLKILTFTSLYPNREQPNHGVFVENRMRHLNETGEVEITVVAPVPWFPFKGDMFGHYASLGRVPEIEERHNLTIYHPRYPVIPKVGMSLAPWLMERALKPFVSELVDRLGGVDVIDSHYFYPDGVAATRIGQALDLPVVITGRGTDLNLIPAYSGPREKIVWAAEHSSAMITVCAALKDSLVDLGAKEDKVTVLRNGVDLETFVVKSRKDCREKLRVDGFVLASVGLLIERKGHHLIIEALQSIPDATLLIAGDGPEQSKLKMLAKTVGVEDRVIFLGNVPHKDLADVYNASDILVLASSREGWANVLLESMACGTPVAATNIWGTPEVVSTRTAGRLCSERSPQGIVDAVADLRSDLPTREAVRAYAEKFSWDDTTNGLLQLLKSVSQSA